MSTNNVTKCSRCGATKTAHQTNGRERWFSVANGGFSKVAGEPVLCEKCQRHDRQELKKLSETSA